ncbi:hypothetical protein [Cupriavidus sp. TMH.W2]|uniref:hypothetical protein n=1 Tax=Cupriavidus sp. TMH.W2 TaxID=3434465 RepID=UPI003D779413
MALLVVERTAEKKGDTARGAAGVSLPPRKETPAPEKNCQYCCFIADGHRERPPRGSMDYLALALHHPLKRAERADFPVPV